MKFFAAFAHAFGCDGSMPYVSFMVAVVYRIIDARNQRDDAEGSCSELACF